MPSLLRRLRGVNNLSRADWYGANFVHNGQPHQVFPSGSLPGSPAENIGGSFERIVRRVRDVNGVAAAAVEARALLVSQLRFEWLDEMTSRRFGTGDLAPLERPGVESRPTMLYRAEEDASWGGNAFIWRGPGNRLFRLRPDWVDIVIGSNSSPTDVMAGADAEVIGYVYFPNGDRTVEPMSMEKMEVAHFAPTPHPLRRFIGSSWVTSILRDIISDGQASEHISQFFEAAATANMVVKAPEGMGFSEFSDWVDMFENAHAGAVNAWSNIYVSAGTDVQVVGSDLAQLDLKQLTGAFEARITVRSRVPAPVLGTREGMQGSALNSGNYGQVRRLWADGWFAPYADMWCAAFEQIVQPPRRYVELTYKRDRVLFLQEDRQDAAEIQQTKAATIRQLIDAGYEPATVVEAVNTDDFAKLRHTGLAPVQVQPVSTLPKEAANA